MIWLAFNTGERVIGEVEARDLDEARLVAWTRWGVSVERVQSKVSASVAEEERQVPPSRRVEDEEDGA